VSIDEASFSADIFTLVDSEGNLKSIPDMTTELAQKVKTHLWARREIGELGMKTSKESGTQWDLRVVLEVIFSPFGLLSP